MSLSLALSLCCTGVHVAAAKAPLEALFMPSDYPAGALAAGQSGDVAVRLEVGTNGRVERCTIVRSSGAPLLDGATCRILKSRARFIPARGTDGAPVTSTAEHLQRWALPAS